MAAILIPLAAKNGLENVLAAGLLAGIILIVAGILKIGHIISFIPKAVITGFTSGIAVIIALGQIENFIGVKSHGEQAYMRIFNLLADKAEPNFYAVGIGLFVILLMLLYPKKWSARFPASLLAVIITTVTQIIFDFPVDTVGAIPRTLIHDTRLSVTEIFNIQFDVIMLPAVSIAALCMIESLLCGAVGGKMRKEKLRSNRELIAQGLGNIVLPFFGGVPATAAIARTSVAIKSGGRTRLTGIIHGVMLLLSMFLLGSLMSQVPLPALAGILIVTAWRMNEWEGIRYIFGRKFKVAIITFTVTLLCTVIFDLTIAIMIGWLLSLVIYVVRISEVEITVSEYDPKRAHSEINIQSHVQVVYITGCIFFGSSEHFLEKMNETSGEVLVLSMRGVPSVDTTGVQTMLEFCEEKKKAGIKVLFCGVQHHVKDFFDRYFNL
jgi:SulP family sulfate permease